MPHIKNALIRYRIIDRCIRNKYKPFPSKKELREACEENLFGSNYGEHICDSTIEKDLFNMRMDHDAPIKYSKKNDGYYYEDPNYSINDIPLTEEDLESIQFAVNTLQQFREVDMFKQFGQAIDKIVDRVAIESKQTLNSENPIVQFETAYSTGGNEFLPKLYESIISKNKVIFNYKSFKSIDFKERIVSPLLLKEYRNRWYLISFDESKNDIITFALERMDNLQTTHEHCKIPKDFDPKKYFEFSTGITAYQGIPELIEIKADSISAKYIQSQPFHHSQELIRENNEFSVFQLKVFISEELIRSFLSFGGEIEVIAPEGLRSILKERSTQLFQKYN
ncbi:MAG: helix-turn-helix transcriptional regulator [Bacteroidota bacterium]